MKVLTSILLIIIAFSSSAFDSESQINEVNLNKYGCVLKLKSSVFENSTVPNDHQSTVGLYYNFFRKRPSFKESDLEFYSKNNEGLLHMITVLPSYGAERHKITVDSVRLVLGQEVIYFDKVTNFDPTLPNFILDAEYVERVYSHLTDNRKLEYIYTYSNQSELTHKPEIRDIKVYSRMFEACIETAE
ncbi:hypothetical protein [Alteromonas flava]|uniref:hypothetical protein n=1 Tax=Alteromonas flava TaxID=2048003 RepID=UPI000C28EA67|nr:hypothetical protein [Alteromonas flava]